MPSSELGNTISTLFGGGASEPTLNVTEPAQVTVTQCNRTVLSDTANSLTTLHLIQLICFLIHRVQDEEEVPPESGNDGKGENSEDEAPKEEAAKEKQEDTERSAGEDNNQENTEDTGSKTDEQVGPETLTPGKH